MNGKWKLIIVAVLATALALWFGISKSPSRTATNNCEGFVRERLKAPATAKFSNEKIIAIDGKLYIVTGDVDSQNSYGAMLRSNYNCLVSRDGTLTNLTLELVRWMQ